MSTPWLRGFLTPGVVWLVLHPKSPTPTSQSTSLAFRCWFLFS